MNKIQCVKIDDFNARINETFPEIIAIIETKLNGDIGNGAMPKNHMIVKKDRSWGTGGGGLCVLVREYLNFKRVPL